MRIGQKALLHVFAFQMTATVVSCGRIGFELLDPDSDITDTGTGADTDTGTEEETETETDTTTDMAISDPLGDSGSFSFVFPYRGRIWMGPRTAGKEAVNLRPGDGSVSEASFSFFRDSTGDNTHDNTASSPYPSIGRTGCTSGTSECGPDNENGRGIFSSGTINGEEWLVVAGGRSDHDLDYIYMTKDTGNILNFSYVDMSFVLGPHTDGTSSMHVFGERLYIGAPDTGGKRPYLVMVINTPTGSGLDGVGNKVDKITDDPCDPTIHDVCTLRAEILSGIGLSADASMIDSITDFAGRLYIANNGGIARSQVAEPLDVFNYPDHWVIVTPSDSDYSSLTSITTNKTADIEPSDKAVPAMVSFKNRLFFARNTEGGPQLWSCTPGIIQGPAPATAKDCDSGDWELVAPSTGTDSRLTQFDNWDNHAISLLEATSNYLYVGFDNGADGIVMFRTASSNPSSASDFTGEAGCNAAGHPGACEGIGGNGLGLTANSRIFSSTFSVNNGKEYLYLVVGDGSAAIKLYFLVR